MRSALLAQLSLLLAACAAPIGLGFDPVTMDAAIDAEAPAALSEVALQSHGARMNGIVYRAAGVGPHPTVVLLHGFPGNERNLDLAQAIRRSGWNVVFFHYRGAWGSEGTLTFSSVLEDVAAVVDTATTDPFALAHAVDAERLAVVGHSMGGFAALVAGSAHDRVDCIVSIAGANLGALAGGLDEESRAATVRTLAGWAGPLRIESGEALVADLEANAAGFDTVALAPRLARKSLLLLAGERDRVTPPAIHHVPLVAALGAAGAASLDTRTFDADHAFSDRRIALAHAVTGWLADSCGP